MVVISSHKKINIVVIDGGIKDCQEFSVDYISGCGIVRKNQNEYETTDYYEDHIGHGTVVVDELLKTCNSFESILLPYGQNFCYSIMRKVYW